MTYLDNFDTFSLISNTFRVSPFLYCLTLPQAWLARRLDGSLGEGSKKHRYPPAGTAKNSVSFSTSSKPFAPGLITNAYGSIYWVSLRSLSYTTLTICSLCSSVIKVVSMFAFCYYINEVSVSSRNDLSVKL